MTKAEKRWLDCIIQIGCICCLAEGVQSPAEPHHMLSGGRRRGHLFSLPLCPPHHRFGMDDDRATSRDQCRKRFEARYGTEEQLLLKVRDMVDARFGLRPSIVSRKGRMTGVDIDAIHCKLGAVRKS